MQCEHGQLKRQCPLCEASKEIDSLRAQLKEAQEETVKWKDRLKRVARFNPDWDMLEATQDSLREHMSIVKQQMDRAEAAEKENKRLRAGLELTDCTCSERTTCFRCHVLEDR